MLNLLDVGPGRNDVSHHLGGSPEVLNKLIRLALPIDHREPNTIRNVVSQIAPHKRGAWCCTHNSSKTCTPTQTSPLRGWHLPISGNPNSVKLVQTGRSVVLLYISSW